MQQDAQLEQMREKAERLEGESRGASRGRDGFVQHGNRDEAISHSHLATMDNLVGSGRLQALRIGLNTNLSTDKMDERHEAEENN